MLKEIMDSAKRQQARERMFKEKDSAYKDYWTCFSVWIPLLENSPDPKARRVAREMRRVAKKAQEILNG